MKLFTLLSAGLLLTGELFAQNLLQFSPVPTPQEVTDAFISAQQGLLDPFIFLPSVIQAGDAAVPALSAVLYSDTLFSSPASQAAVSMLYVDSVGSSKPKSDSLRPNRIFAVMALEGIGTQSAYLSLLRAAQLPNEVNVRGLALNAVANTFHNAEYLNRIKPDTTLLHLLLKNVDDTTKIPHLGYTFGSIARKGMISWTGVDPGEPQGSNTKMAEAISKTSMTLSAFRELWWQANSLKIRWNSTAGRFVLP